MGIADRYASAVHAPSLKPKGTKGRDEDKPQSVDVLGAFGLADRTLTDGHDRQGRNITPAPLAVPLARLLSGDARAVYEIVRILAEEAFTQSYVLQVRVSEQQCTKLAQATLAWFRSGTCKTCNGLKYERAPGSPALTGRDCMPCGGTGKIPFKEQFDKRQQPLAEWMRDEIERSVQRAAPQAMKHLAHAMDRMTTNAEKS